MERAVKQACTVAVQQHYRAIILALLDIFCATAFACVLLYTPVCTYGRNSPKSQVTVGEGFMKRWGVSPIFQRRIICLMSTQPRSGARALFGHDGSFGYLRSWSCSGELLAGLWELRGQRGLRVSGGSGGG